MSKAGPWIREHLVEVVGVVIAALALLILWLRSRGGSSTVAPASIQTPLTSTTGSSGSSGGGLTSADVQTAIQSALGGYVTTAQEQADIQAAGSNQQSLWSTALAQLSQTEQQDVATVTANLSSLSTQFQNASQQWAQTAQTLTGQQQQAAQQLAALNQQVAQNAAAGNLTAQQLNTFSSQANALLAQLYKVGITYPVPGSGPVSSYPTVPTTTNAPTTQSGAPTVYKPLGK